jgi:hypothetical protein
MLKVQQDALAAMKGWIAGWKAKRAVRRGLDA